MDPRHVRPSHIDRHLTEERKNAPKVANKEIAFFSSVFQFGIRRHDLPANPCREVRRNTVTPRTRLPERVELDAIERIATARGPAFEMITLIARLTAIAGQRRQDILRIMRPATDATRIRVTIAKRKRSEAPVTVEIPMTLGVRTAVERALELTRDAPPSLFLFCNRSGQPYTDAGFKTLWQRLMNAFEKAGGERFTYHDLRALYVSTGLAQGKRVTEATGHRSESTPRRIYDRRRVRKAEPTK